MNSHDTVCELRDFRSIVVHARDDVAAFGKARSCDESDVSGSDYTDLHDISGALGQSAAAPHAVAPWRAAYRISGSEGGAIIMTGSTALDFTHGRGKSQTRQLPEADAQ
jgi:hypothetical protein